MKTTLPTESESPIEALASLPQDALHNGKPYVESAHRSHQVAEPVSIAPDSTSTTSPSTTVRQLAWKRPALLALLVVLGAGVIAGAAYRNQEKVKSFFQPAPPESTPRPVETISIEIAGIVAVTADTPLEKKLKILTVDSETLSVPALSVAGSVVARLGMGAGEAESRWDFATPEIASAYGDWIKARADVKFTTEQSLKVKKLAEERVKYLVNLIVRQEGLAKIGVLEEQVVASTRNDKLQAELTGEKDVYEANNAVKVAERNRGLLERQLLQAGVNPETMLKATEGIVLVVADVPEAKINLVDKGQACEARFVALPNDEKPFEGYVGLIGPSVSSVRRTLRVTFELPVANAKLLPGMYADVGLGTHKRKTLTVPADAVLHIGRHDYVLVEEERGRFRIRLVVVGEPVPAAAKSKGKAEEQRIVVREGLIEKERVVSDGAILLKPMAVKSLADSGNE